MDKDNKKTPDTVESNPAPEILNVAEPSPEAATIKPAFEPDARDAAFALFSFVLGYLFALWVFPAHGWGVSLFTVLYLGSISLYLVKKGAKFDLSAWYWLGLTVLTGLSFSLYGNEGLIGGVAMLLLFCSAIYYVLSLSKKLIEKKTGNLLLLDGINALLCIPFRNFFNQYKSFMAYFKNRKKGRLVQILVGIVIALFVLVIILPLLLRADSGGFGELLDSLVGLLELKWLDTFIVCALCSIPISAYIFGLASGAANSHAADTFKEDKVKENVVKMRIFAPATVLIVLTVMCLVYAVFICTQIPYFFSAFSGRTQFETQAYSDYARDGFFEMCQIVTINMLVLALANVMSKKNYRQSLPLKILNILLALITLLLVVTAMSKMALYIGAQGITIMRIMTMTFMVFVTAVCVAVIVRQFRDFAIARFALVFGATLLLLLCLSNPNALVARYNADRYLNGTLPNFGVGALYQVGYAGVEEALDIYDSSDDVKLKINLTEYLREQFNDIQVLQTEIGRANLELLRAQKAYELHDFISNTSSTLSR